MTTTRLLTTLLVAGSVLTACGGDDDSDEAASTEPAAESTAASPAASAEPEATPTPAGDARTDCPDAAEIAPVYGSELTLVEDQAMTGAVGLVFCPYAEVLAPGTTGAFGGEPIPDEFSITFTDQNIVVPGEGEEVAELGEAASWSGTDLGVWTGEQGIIVSIVFDPPAGDAKTVSIAIAEQLLSR